AERDLAGDASAMEACDAAGERRLAGAGLADERQALLWGDRQGDVEQHLALAVRRVHVARSEEQLVAADLRERDGRRPLARGLGEDVRRAVAAHLVPVGDPRPLGKLGVAEIDDPRAARREEAALRAVA